MTTPMNQQAQLRALCDGLRAWAALKREIHGDPREDRDWGEREDFLTEDHPPTSVLLYDFNLEGADEALLRILDAYLTDAGYPGHPVLDPVRLKDWIHVRERAPDLHELSDAIYLNQWWVSALLDSPDSDG